MSLLYVVAFWINGVLIPLGNFSEQQTCIDYAEESLVDTGFQHECFASFRPIEEA